MEVAIQAMNNILGGQFTSRINMNLREDKHWSYGAHSRIYGARGQRPFVTSAPVQTDKTKESMVEMAKELRGILTDMPITEAELSKVKKQETLELAENGKPAAQLQLQLPNSFDMGCLWIITIRRPNGYAPWTWLKLLRPPSRWFIQRVSFGLLWAIGKRSNLEFESGTWRNPSDRC